jgi:hypothetical protein
MSWPEVLFFVNLCRSNQLQARLKESEKQAFQRDSASLSFQQLLTKGNDPFPAHIPADGEELFYS